MNPIFRCNNNAKYSTKDLKVGYDSNNFWLLDLHLDGKGSSVKIQLMNIVKDHHIIARLSPIAVVYDEWSLSNACWMKFYISYCKYSPEWNEYFHMYRCQLNFAMSFATSAFDISWQQLNHQVFPCLNNTASSRYFFTTWRWF